MKTKQAVDFFGSKSKVAKALSLSRQAVTSWGDEVPASRVYQLLAVMQVEQAKGQGVNERAAKSGGGE